MKPRYNIKRLIRRMRKIFPGEYISASENYECYSHGTHDPNKIHTTLKIYNENGVTHEFLDFETMEDHVRKLEEERGE